MLKRLALISLLLLPIPPGCGFIGPGAPPVPDPETGDITRTPRRALFEVIDDFVVLHEFFGDEVIALRDSGVLPTAPANSINELNIRIAGDTATALDGLIETGDDEEVADLVESLVSSMDELAALLPDNQPGLSALVLRIQRYALEALDIYRRDTGAGPEGGL